MGKKRKSRGGTSGDKFNSDDDKPDKGVSSYYQDEVDEFHASRDKILLDEGADIAQNEEHSEEEVLGLGGSSSDEDDDEIAEYEKRLRSLNVNQFKDEHASDLSDEEDADEKEDGKAWGGKRGKFYGADFVDDRKIQFDGEEIDPQVLEAQEAEVMERRMAEQLDEADFDLDIFQKPADDAKEEKVEDSESRDVVSRDVSGLSRREKLDLLQQESPEMLTLIQDFQDKLGEAQTRLLPIQEKIKDGSLPASKGVDYVNAKVQLILNYCSNISFYLTLKAKRVTVHNHPVIKRLLQYRNLIEQMAPLDEKMTSEVDAMMDRIRTGRPLVAEPQKPDNVVTYQRRKKEYETKSKDKQEKKKKKLSELLSEEELEEVKKHKNDEKKEAAEAREPHGSKTVGRKRNRDDGRYETAEEREALEFYEILRSGKRSKQPDDEQEESTAQKRVNDEVMEENGEGTSGEEMSGDDSDEEEQGKRAITYQMASNKGLMPKRKKEQRNPRVKNKRKFRKALIRRRGAVREARTEMTRYAGELSGIRAGVKKSTKFKS